MFINNKKQEGLLDKGHLLAIFAVAAGAAVVGSMIVIKGRQKRKRGKIQARSGQSPSRDHIKMAGRA